MSLGKNITRFASIVIVLALAACSSSSSGGGNAILSAVQDLTADPDGMTTTVTFSKAPGVLTPANFASDGTANAIGVIVAATTATVSWNERVTPADSIQAVGISGVSAAFMAVTTSNATAPTFTVTGASQVPGLGTDTLQITFAGPRMVETLAEDPANWDLVVNLQSLDLTGSTFSLNPATQVLDITLGQNANLHAAFSIEATGLMSVADIALATGLTVGAATGDTTAPTLISANQNLTEDEFGRIVDFTFDEAMDPVFSTGLARFGVTLPEVATAVSQPTGDVLRVTFSGPVVPAVDNVTLSGLVDAHGNAYPTGPQAIAQPAPVVNTYSPIPVAATVENAINDTITVITTQAFDPDSAILPASWVMNVNAAPIDLSMQTVAYDFLTKTLTVTLNFDMQNGDAFDITGNVLEVDGQTFNSAFIGGVVGGDATAPTVAGVLQNRTLDPTGMTLDVQMSEDVDSVEAQNIANWAVTGGVNVLTATLQPNLDVVRLTLDAVAVPGDVTASGDAVEDLAGNGMPAPQAGLVITSTDATVPTAVTGVANALEGALNDSIIVVFDDRMIQAEAEDDANWTIESPVGTPVPTAGTTISYNPASQRTTLIFDAGTTVNLQRGDDYSVAFANMRDIGGNIIGGGSVTGPVLAETTLPAVHTIFRDAITVDEVVIYFTEPSGMLDDVYVPVTNTDGSRYVLRDNIGGFKADATIATVLNDGLGVRVDFGVVVGATDTIDVINVQDLAGNPMFPQMAVPTVAEDATLPSLDTGVSTCVSISGESNDVVTIVFDRAMSPWQILNSSNYVVDPGAPIDLSTADFAFDGDRTVSITLLSRDDLQTGGAHTVTVNNIYTAQGIPRTVADTEVGILATGDVALPTVIAGDLRVDPLNANSLLVEVDEAVDKVAAETAANYNYNGGSFATSAVQISPRTVRATFGVTPVIGLNTDVTVTDLAGNASGVLTRAVTAADTDSPIIVPPTGTSVSNVGGDYVVVGFNEPVDPAIAVNVNNYAIHNSGAFLDLTNAVAVYDSSSLTVTIYLPAGQELDPSAAITVTIQNIADLSGNALPGPVVAGGAVGGDMTAPDFASAYVNYRQDPTGLIVDVLFDEDVDTAFVEDELNWTASGGQTINTVTLMNSNFARVQLATPLGPAETLDIVTGLADVAGNATVGAINVVPEQ
jgi:hypothetical protein